MKHFFKPALFIGSLFLVLAILFSIGETSYSEYDTKRRRIEDIITNRERVTALVVGASHGLAILPDKLGFKNSYNLCDGGTDLFELDYKLRSLLPLLPNLNTVIISVSYFSFSYDNAAYKNPKNGQHTRSEKRREVYATFPTLRWIKGDVDNFVAGKLFPIITQDHWEKVFSRTIGILAAEDKEDENKVVPKIINSPKGLDDHGRRRAKNEYANNIHNMKKYHPNLEKHTYVLMENLLKYLKEKGIRTILVISPFWKTYSETFPDYFKKLLLNNLISLSNSYAIEIYNFSESNFFQMRPELFHNSDHLNKNSYAIFCQLLKTAMEKRHSGIEVIHGEDLLISEDDLMLKEG